MCNILNLKCKKKRKERNPNLSQVKLEYLYNPHTLLLKNVRIHIEAGEWNYRVLVKSNN